MEGVYENHYRYSTTCARVDRTNYTAVEWFDRIKNQCDLNRPLHYRITGHSIVGDGWQEIGIPTIRQYHMNYGWTNTSYNTWYTLDALYGSTPADEYMLENIVPAQAMAATFAGNYPAVLWFPFRYFDQDAMGWNAVFQPGQNLQCLPDITVTCTGVPGDYVKFLSNTAQNSHLFTRGDLTEGVRLCGGGIKLHPTGSIKLH